MLRGDLQHHSPKKLGINVVTTDIGSALIFRTAPQALLSSMSQTLLTSSMGGLTLSSGELSSVSAEIASTQEHDNRTRS